MHGALRLHTTPAPLKAAALAGALCLAVTAATVLPTLCLYRQQCSAYATNGRVTYAVAASDAIVPSAVILLLVVVPLSFTASRTQVPAIALAAFLATTLSAVLLLAAGFGSLGLLPSSADLASAAWAILSPASRATYGSVTGLESEMRADMAAAAVAALVAGALAVLTAAAHAAQVRRMMVVWRAALATASWPPHRLGWCRVSPLAVMMDLPVGGGAGGGVPWWLAAACACRPPSVAVSYPDPCGCSRLRAIELPPAGAGGPSAGWGRGGGGLAGMLPWNRGGVGGGGMGGGGGATAPAPPPLANDPAALAAAGAAPLQPQPIGAAPVGGVAAAPAPAPLPVSSWGMLPGAAASPPHTPARP